MHSTIKAELSLNQVARMAEREDSNPRYLRHT